MKIAAICPTFRRPNFLSNSIMLWQAQDYPKHLRKLFILDDGGTFKNQKNDLWEIHTSPRVGSLSSKYNMLLKITEDFKPDAFLVWEDDDIYFPEYVTGHVASFNNAPFSKPSWVYMVDNFFKNGEIKKICKRAMLHSTIGFTKSLIDKVGGYPENNTAIFDRILIDKLYNYSDVSSPDFCNFVYRFHAKLKNASRFMDSDNDCQWYERVAASYPDVQTKELNIAFDLETTCIANKLKINLNKKPHIPKRAIYYV